MSRSYEDATRRRNPPRNKRSSIFSSTFSDEEDSEFVNTSSTFFERETDPEFFPSSSEEEEEEQEDIIIVTLSRGRYPETTKHIEDAIAAGQPAILTINRAIKEENRKQSLRGFRTVPGKDRDEYPPAMTDEGGAGADVRYISSSDNRGAGSSIKAQLSEYPDGTRFRIKITK